MNLKNVFFLLIASASITIYGSQHVTLRRHDGAAYTDSDDRQTAEPFPALDFNAYEKQIRDLVTPECTNENHPEDQREPLTHYLKTPNMWRSNDKPLSVIINKVQSSVQLHNPGITLFTSLFHFFHLQEFSIVSHHPPTKSYRAKMCDTLARMPNVDTTKKNKLVLDLRGIEETQAQFYWSRKQVVGITAGALALGAGFGFVLAKCIGSGKKP